MHLGCKRGAGTATLLRRCFVGAAGAFVISCAAAQAATVEIAAIGASNTAGLHAGAGQAWPAQLERMLKAKGLDVHVSVQGVVGDTSAGILRRVGSIPAGTKVVIYDVGKGNDRDQGNAAQSAANKEKIAQAIRARGAEPIFVPYAQIVGSEKSNPAAWRPNDPHHHLTVASHARVAAWLVPKVTAAIGKH
jgi:acyl-CoA thioesterase-1